MSSSAFNEFSQIRICVNRLNLWIVFGDDFAALGNPWIVSKENFSSSPWLSILTLCSASSRSMTTALSRKVLQFDGGFLLLAGGAAMIIETVGHFWGVGPLAEIKGSPSTIGSFEAHGLALIFAVLLIRAANLSERSLWHRVGLIVHLLLGCSNLLFWPSFVQLHVVPMGVITTVLHFALVIAHGLCLWRRP